MSDQSFVSLARTCPRCHKGPLFAGFLKLAKSCSACGLVYEQEIGQMWGAMVLTYAFSAAIALPLFFILLMNRTPHHLAIGIPILVLVVISPINVRLSRMLWTHAMYLMNPAGRGR